MYRRTITVALLVAFVGLFASSSLAQAEEYWQRGHKQRGRTLVVQLLGADVGEMRQIDTDGDGENETEANCFDVPLVDPQTGWQLGTASDCLSDAEVVNEADPACTPAESLNGCAVRLVDTTFFRFKYHGTIVSQGSVTIQPVLDPDTLETTTTHITGSIPHPLVDNILYGTERFTHAKGSVRLSGAVDMGELAERNVIDFNCLFIIRLEPVKRGDR